MNRAREYGTHRGKAPLDQNYSLSHTEYHNYQLLSGHELETVGL